MCAPHLLLSLRHLSEARREVLDSPLHITRGGRCEREEREREVERRRRGEARGDVSEMRGGGRKEVGRYCASGAPAHSPACPGASDRYATCRRRRRRCKSPSRGGRRGGSPAGAPCACRGRRALRGLRATREGRRPPATWRQGRGERRWERMGEGGRRWEKVGEGGRGWGGGGCEKMCRIQGEMGTWCGDVSGGVGRCGERCGEMWGAAYLKSIKSLVEVTRLLQVDGMDR